MPAKLVVGFVVIALHGRLFEGSVHSLDLTICPRMVWFGQAMFDSVVPARAIKRMAAQHCGWTFAVFRQIGELDAVVGQHDFDLIGDGFDQLVEERDGCRGVGLLNQPGEGELRRAIDGDEQEQFAFLRTHLGDVDMHEADRVGLELLL